MICCAGNQGSSLRPNFTAHFLYQWRSLRLSRGHRPDIPYTLPTALTAASLHHASLCSTTCRVCNHPTSPLPLHRQLLNPSSAWHLASTALELPHVLIENRLSCGYTLCAAAASSFFFLFFSPRFLPFYRIQGRCPQRPPSKHFTLAAQTLPAIQTPHVHYPHRFQHSLTPPYNDDTKPYPDEARLTRRPGIPEPSHSWSAHEGQRGSDDKALMSRPTAPGFPSSAADDASRRLQQTTPQMSPTSLRAGVQPFPRVSPYDGAAHQSVSLPPLRQLSSTPPTPSSDRRPGNPLGVHSILNPQADLVEQQRARGRSASQMESPSPVETQPSQSLPSISRPTSVESTQDDPLPARPFQPPGRPQARNLLSPRSPTLHRTQSLGVLNPPTGTIDAHQSPFLTASARPFGPDAATSQPGLPTPPVGPRATYFPTVAPTAPTPPPNLARNEQLRRPSVSFPQSGSASPIASYSPYSQPASVASSQFETSSQQGFPAPIHMQGQGQESNNPPIAVETERGLIPMQPSGQSTIQMMTIKSQQGHHVQIPVDVQAASKVADEKRKRNAGASARFRARRKEKEREASMSISRLEQQLREALEDIDYYRGERDYFKSIVFQQPGAERHYARPPSPRLRRLSAAPSNAPSSTGGGSGSSYSGYEDLENGRESDRNVRRRTSSYHPATGPPPTALNGSGPPSQSYPTATYQQANPQLPTAHAPNRPPPQQFDPREQRPLPELQPPSQRPLLRDPFASDASRFENRGWVPGPNRESRG